MSTNKQKIYCKEDIKLAQKLIKNNERYFARKTNKRKTVQVRISEKWHKKIKEMAKSEKTMISFFLDRISEYFFKHYE